MISVKKAAFPITPCILLKIGKQIRRHVPFELTMWSLFLTSFFLMLRKSNVCKTSGMDDNYLRHKHITVKNDHILVNVFWTKSMQLGERVLQLPLLPVANSELCPVKAMLDMFRMVPGEGDAPLFSKANGFPITYPSYLKFLKNKIHQVGLNHNNYSTHSFRRGAASWALSCGVPESVIQMMGDWKSDCYKRYINCPLESRMQFARCITNNL